MFKGMDARSFVHEGQGRPHGDGHGGHGGRFPRPPVPATHRPRGTRKARRRREFSVAEERLPSGGGSLGEAGTNDTSADDDRRRRTVTGCARGTLRFCSSFCGATVFSVWDSYNGPLGGCAAIVRFSGVFLVAATFRRWALGVTALRRFVRTWGRKSWSWSLEVSLEVSVLEEEEEENRLNYSGGFLCLVARGVNPAGRRFVRSLGRVRSVRLSEA